MKTWLAAVMLLVATLAQAGEWELQSSKDGISVYTADIPGQELRGFRGVTTLAAPMRSVVALLADTGNMPNWFFHMKAARELDLPGTDTYRYLVIAGIWPVSDRDAVVRVSSVQQADGSIVMTAVGQPDKYPQQSCCVRIPRMESSWTVRAVDADHTEVMLTTKSHPGGSLPLWIANLVATDMPRKTLVALRREVRKPAYAHVDSQGSAASRAYLSRFRF